MTTKTAKLALIFMILLPISAHAQIEVCVPGRGSLPNGWCTQQDILDINSIEYQAWKGRMEACMTEAKRRAPDIDPGLYEWECEEKAKPARKS